MTSQNYLLRLLLGLLASVLVAIVLATTLPVLIQAVNKVPGIRFSLLLRFMPLSMGAASSFLLPIGFLMAVVGTYARLARDNELVAFKMSGFHPMRLLMPGILLALALTAASPWLVGFAGPRCRMGQSAFLHDAAIETFKALAAHATELDLGTFYLKAQSRSGDTLHDVLIGAPSAKGEEVLVRAEAATLRIEDEEYLDIAFGGATMLLKGFLINSEAPSLRLRLSELLPRKPFKDTKAKYRSTAELYRELSAGGLEPKRERDVRYELHSRHAICATYLLFLLVGAATGVLVSHAGQMSAFACAVGYCFVYYLLSMRLGKELMLSNAIPVPVAAWTTNGLFLALGVVLTRRVFWR